MFIKIVIIGTGNTATILGRKLKLAGHHISQVVGRNETATRLLAKEWGSTPITNWQGISSEADLYLLAVSDSAVNDVLEKVNVPAHSLLVHTAASVSLQVLKGKTTRYGVFYPLQSLRKEVAHLPPIPLLLDASDATTLDQLRAIAQTITSQVWVTNDETRTKMHLAAVIINNFSNHLYTLVEAYCQNESLDFKLLLPLLRETVGRLEDYSPAELQTGPAVRNDTVTIQKHLQSLDTYPTLQHLYETFTAYIQEKA